MRKVYNKLVRDGIPSIIAAEGRHCEVVTLDKDEYRVALLSKLVEEAQEAAAASPDQLVTELADVYEVLAALIAATGLTAAQIAAVQTERRQTRGGFAQRIKLLWTE
jgi:predicted house-cleaning noncanonical NTP pyrophosphatase (MazG superfamily)